MRKLQLVISVLLCWAGVLNVYARSTFNDQTSGIVVTRNGKFAIANQLDVTNGKVETSKNGILEGTRIIYNAGRLVQENGTDIVLTGEFNPDEDTLTLANQTFNALPGNIAQDVNLSGNSLLEGTPTNFASPTGVKLAGADSVLNLALSSPLATNVGMNDGTVKLQGSTKLGDGKTLIGNGTLEFNGNSLSLGGVPITLGGNLLLKKAADWTFNSKVTVTGQLTFDGDGQVTGNGNLLDISLGGTIAIRPNTAIYMTNLKLRGLGLGKIMFYDDTSQLYMSNVEVEMDRNYSVTIGGIYMEGPTNIVTKDKLLTFDQNGSLTVDGIALTYDTLGFPNQNNIVPLPASNPSQSFVTLLNDGVIRRLDNYDIVGSTSNAVVALASRVSANSNGLVLLDRMVRTSSNAFAFGIKNNSETVLKYGTSDAVIITLGEKLALQQGVALLNVETAANSNAIVRLNDQVQTVYGPEPVIVTTTAYTLSTDVNLSFDHLMLVKSGPGFCTIDGGGHTISFALLQAGLLQIDPGIVVTVTNVVLKNYSEAAVLLGSGSSIQFGADVRVELASDQTVARDWVFAGANTILAGNGNRLTLGTGSIIVRLSSVLWLQSVGIDGLKNSNLRCDDAKASVLLESSQLYMTNNMSFSTGALGVLQDVLITGSNTFGYQSDQLLVVYPASSLSLNGINFEYLPSTDNRDLIWLVDRSSRLSIDGCTLSSSTTGMRLTRGTLVVDGVNKLVNTGALSLSEGFCFGDGNTDNDLDIQIKPGGSLSLINGMIDYANVN